MVEIEVGDEVFDGVVGEELFELGVELSGEGFVVGDDEGGAAEISDDVGGSERFAGTGDPEEGLVSVPCFKRTREFGDGLGLIALRLHF